MTINRELLTHASDAELVAGSAAEMQEKIESLDFMPVMFQPQTVFSLVAMLQLALRKSDLEAVGAPTAAERFIQSAREYFAACPHVLEMIRRGDAHDYDRPART